MSNLAGQSAILTGGSTELARAVALALSRQDVSVILCGKSAQLVEDAATAIRAEGGKCLPVLSDLQTLEEAEQIVRHTIESYGQLDLLITVSPFFAGGQIHSQSLRNWDAVINANLREAFLINRAVLPIFREQKRGQMLAIGSDSGLGAYAHDGAFGVAMHGLIALMQQIQVENVDYGIRAHILCPGLALAPSGLPDIPANLTLDEVANWVIWLLTRPNHLRGNGPILI